MKNRYSITLLIIMIALVIVGGFLVYQGSHWITGFILITLGSMMARGFRELSPGNPREAGLITLLGVRTKTVTQGLTLLLDWIPMLPEIIGVVVFDMQVADEKFTIDSIRCADGVRMNGFVSIRMQPNPKALSEFDDVQRMDGVKVQVDDMVVADMAEIAAEKDMDYKWMETQTDEISKMLVNRLAGLRNGSVSRINFKPTPDRPVTIEGLGIIVTKLQVKLKPISEDIIKADERVELEKLERVGEKADTETINQRALDRYKMYKGNVKKINLKNIDQSLLEKCRREVVFETLVKDKKVEVITGENLNITQKGGKGK